MALPGQAFSPAARRAKAIIQIAEASDGIGAGWKNIQSAREALDEQRAQLAKQEGGQLQPISFISEELRSVEGELLLGITPARGLRQIIGAILLHVRQRATILDRIAAP